MTPSKTLYRAAYCISGSLGDHPLHVWELMRTCASDTDPDFYKDIVGWEWELSLGEKPRYTIYALFESPTTAGLWRLISREDDQYEHERFSEMKHAPEEPQGGAVQSVSYGAYHDRAHND